MHGQLIEKYEKNYHSYHHKMFQRIKEIILMSTEIFLLVEYSLYLTVVIFCIIAAFFVFPFTSGLNLIIPVYFLHKATVSLLLHILT